MIGVHGTSIPEALTCGLTAGETEAREQDRSIQVYRAYQALRCAGTVVIAGDGGKGGRGVTVPFFGGQRRFRQGGAELAVQTGARLVPVLCSVAASGAVIIDVVAPLCISRGSPETQIEAATRAYAELVIERWPQAYADMAWDNLARTLKRTAPMGTGAP